MLEVGADAPDRPVNHDTVYTPEPCSSCPSLPHNALEPILEPLDRLLLVNAVGGADAGLAALALGDALTWAGPVKLISYVPYTIPDST
jgi:hypothetical protein